jgi:hypothetical protein
MKMNKYQKQAIVDMAKVAGAVIAVIGTVAFIIQMGMSASDLFGALSLAGMFYCIYQLYLVRVGQLESQDKLSEMERKYK